MGEGLIPTEITNAAAPINALAHNPAGVQFAHRWLAVIAAATMLAFWGCGRKFGVSFPALNALALMALVQISLGLATLYSGVNIVLATLHQAGAAIIIGLLVYTLYTVRPDKNNKI
jgi:cytochrome c oxidase assembly protein subunit 15